MDGYIANLREYFQISENATDQEVQQIATKMLDDAKTNFYGAELLLGRRIDSSETNIVRIFAFSPLSQDKQPIVDTLLSLKTLEGWERA